MNVTPEMVKNVVTKPLTGISEEAKKNAIVEIENQKVLMDEDNESGKK